VRSDAEAVAASLEVPSAFGLLFDRHATTLFRYFVRRVGPDEADTLLGELFRIAFERWPPSISPVPRRDHGCTASRAICSLSTTATRFGA
jgi:hypothetical protein